MKKKLPLLLLILVAIVYGCSNNDDSNIVPDNADIIGQWNWLESSGGFLGTTETPESTGDTITLTISDTTVKRYLNGVLVSDLPYTVAVQPSIFGGISEMLILPEDVKISFEVQNGILLLSEECADCYFSTYESI